MGQNSSIVSQNIPNDDTIGAEEIDYLSAVFRKIVDDSPNQSRGQVSKEMFTAFFTYPGILRNQLFQLCDKSNTGWVSRQDFIDFFGEVCFGSYPMRLKFIFRLFDISRSGCITRHDLSTVLSSSAYSSFEVLSHQDVKSNPPANDTCDTDAQFSAMDDDVAEIVTQAFLMCADSHQEKLNEKEFARWVTCSPEVWVLAYGPLSFHGMVDMVEFEADREDFKEVYFPDDD
eukprot:Rmarinus@m.3665